MPSGDIHFQTVLLISLKPLYKYHNNYQEICRPDEIFIRQKETVTCTESAPLEHAF